MSQRIPSLDGPLPQTVIALYLLLRRANWQGCVEPSDQDLWHVARDMARQYKADHPS